MKKNARDIYHRFEGKLVGSFLMKVHVCETLVQMPDEIIDYITTNCWFFGSMEDAWAFTLTGNDLANQHLIFISDELLMQNPDQIQHTIVHEIGHVVLKHRNAILVHQSKKEIQKQEKEANAFATKYLS